MNKAFRGIVAHVAYPLLISWPLIVCWVALRMFQAPADPLWRKGMEVGMFLVSAIPVVLSLLILEKKMPFWPERKPSGQDVRNDLTHLAMCWFVLVPIAQALMRVMAFAIIGALAAAVGTGLWPSHWPMIPQLALALVIGEFGQYWFHRMGHETEFGWRVHSVHHGPHQVYWLNSTRFHAFELVVRMTFQTAPLIILGCTQETFMVYGVFTAIHGWVQHSNVDYKTGFFNVILGTSSNHRWHHSVDVAEANHNYGLVVLVWDRLFGTFHSPKVQFTGKVGIGDMPDFPTNYVGQFLTPFKWKEMKRTLASPPPALEEEDDEMERETA